MNDAITNDNRYVEVTLLWGNTVADVKRVRDVERFTIGDAGCDLNVPVDGGAHTLLTSREGTWLVHPQDAPPQVLSDGTTVSLAFGAHTVQVQTVAKSRAFPIIPFFDALWANVTTTIMLVAAAAIAVLALYPTGMDALDDDLLVNPSKFQALILKPTPKDNAFLSRLTAPSASSSKTPQKQPQKENVKKSDKETAAKRADKPSNNDVVASKLNALFGNSGGLASMFNTSDNSVYSAVGALNGTLTASVTGKGSLDVRGTRLGADGDVSTFGVGDIRTLGRGEKYGEASGALIGKEDRDIEVKQGTVEATGSLDKGIIARVVREHGGQVRYCYEQELTRTPGLHGRVVMKWVINGDGKVTQASKADSQLHNANVENCLEQRIKSWVFPKPRGGGVVVVSYPFVFKQGGS